MNLTRLYKLREVGNEILSQELPLDFDTWGGDSGCSTFACLGGWYVRAINRSHHPMGDVFEWLCHHFEINTDDVHHLFGANSVQDLKQDQYDVLRDRLAYLDELITCGERQQREVPPGSYQEAA